MQVFGRFAKSHSQIRATFHPALRKDRFTNRSRFWLPSILRRHHAARCAGHVACFGQPCQKQPSTKIAARDLRKTKSGRTASRGLRVEGCRAAPSPLWGKDGRRPDEVFPRFRLRLSTVARINKWRRQPLIPFARNSRASASSVSRLPRERIRDMISERFALEKTSAIYGNIGASGGFSPPTEKKLV